MKVIRRPVKRVRIELRDGEIVVIAPRGVRVEEVVERKREWIERNLRKIEEIRERARRDVDARGVRILDKYYTVRNSCRNVGVRGNAVYVCRSRADSLRRMLREMLREDLRERVERYSKALGVRPNRIFIKEHKTKWGSCSAAKNLNFNLRLVFLPEEFRDYIVAHEVAHLLHMNHGREFKKALGSLGVRIPSRDEMLFNWYYAETCKEMLRL